MPSPVSDQGRRALSPVVLRGGLEAQVDQLDALVERALKTSRKEMESLQTSRKNVMSSRHSFLFSDACHV
jgi:hypothetical protein